MIFLGEFLFFIGLISIVINRLDIIKVIFSIELMIAGIIAKFLISSILIDDLFGEIFSMFILTVAAGESAIGLGILVSYFGIRENVEISNLNLIQG